MAGADASSTPLSFDRAAMKKRAAVLQAQWDDYQKRFMPIEQNLIDIAGKGYHTNLLDHDIKNASDGINNAYDSAKSSSDRADARFGVSNPAQDGVMQNNLALSKSASMDGAINTIRDYDITRRQALVSGASGNASASTLGTSAAK